MTKAARNEEATGAREIVIERVFDAPRERVFENWIAPENVQTWFAPRGFEVTSCELDARPGGRWRVEYSSAKGEHHIEWGEMLEIAFPERLVLTLTQQERSSGRSGPTTTVSVTFLEHGPRTKMIFRQTGFASQAHRDGNAEGWQECFGKLDGNLSRTGEHEIRELFAAWFDASTRKDLDASMAPIARDIVSYEHETPLQYTSVDEIRAVCARGFSAMEGDFRWDIPDLHVIVRGDIAVTWGLNRMRAEQPGKPAFESHSRGTRVFQKIDGTWKMIHQHVSFPYDPATGNVKTDLRP